MNKMADNQTSTSSQQQVRLLIFTIPRSTSTVLAKCLSFVEDSVMHMEPYTCAYVFGPDAIFNTQPADKSTEETLGTLKETVSQLDMECPPNAFDVSQCSYKWVKKQLDAAYSGKRFICCKDMAYAVTGRESFLPEGYRYVFLIRHPLKVFSSMKKLVGNIFPNKDLDELDEGLMPAITGYGKLSDLLDHVKNKRDQEAIVIDADDLLENPKGILSALFKAIGLPFDEKILNWEAGDAILKSWFISKTLLAGNQLQHVYKNALDSTCFLKPRGLPDRSSLSPDILRCVDRSIMDYEKVYAQRLKPE